MCGSMADQILMKNIYSSFITEVLFCNSLSDTWPNQNKNSISMANAGTESDDTEICMIGLPLPLVFLCPLPLYHSFCFLLSDCHPAFMTGL